jgi:1-acyl-sn-glycerol-3-phosphate acyltransferase
VLLAYLYFCFTIFLVVMVVLYPLMQWVPALLKGIGLHNLARQVGHTSYRLWGGSFFLMGVRFTIRGKEHIPRVGPVLFVANHRSLLDSPALFWAISRPFKVLGKIELSRFPVFGNLYRSACIVVDRASASSRSASLKAIGRELEQGNAILVFPEGRMNPAALPLQPFQTPVFDLALQHKATIIPIAIANSGTLLPSIGKFRIHPGIIRVTILPATWQNEYGMGSVTASGVGSSIRGTPTAEQIGLATQSAITEALLSDMNTSSRVTTVLAEHPRLKTV